MGDPSRDNSRPKIICCDVLRDEIAHVAPGWEIEYVEGALHDFPDRLRAALNERVAATPGERTILLAYGRCSNGTVGLEAGRHRLVLPAVDDCISLLLGSRARYLDEFARHPGTYYYTRGWIEYIEDPYHEYQRMAAKYGEERARRLAFTILEHYTRFATIDMGTHDLDRHQDYLATVSAFYDLPVKKLEGSFRFFDKLVRGPYDDEFIVVEPGCTLDESRFWDLATA